MNSLEDKYFGGEGARHFLLEGMTRWPSLSVGDVFHQVAHLSAVHPNISVDRV